MTIIDNKIETLNLLKFLTLALDKNIKDNKWNFIISDYIDFHINLYSEAKENEKLKHYFIQSDIIEDMLFLSKHSFYEQYPHYTEQSKEKIKYLFPEFDSNKGVKQTESTLQKHGFIYMCLMKILMVILDYKHNALISEENLNFLKKLLHSSEIKLKNGIGFVDNNGTASLVHNGLVQLVLQSNFIMKSEKINKQLNVKNHLDLFNLFYLQNIPHILDYSNNHNVVYTILRFYINGKHRFTSDTKTFFNQNLNTYIDDLRNLIDLVN